jgi:hypothetical protein
MKNSSLLVAVAAGLVVFAAAAQLDARQIVKVKGTPILSPNADGSLASPGTDPFVLDAIVPDGAGAGMGGPGTCAGPSNGSVDCGQTVTGRLEPGDAQLGDGSFIDVFIFTLGAPSVVQIDQTSTAVDSFIILADTACNILAANDDCVVCCNSCLTVFLPAGTYLVVPNTFAGGEIGTYSVRVSCQGLPPVPVAAGWGFALLVAGVLAAGMVVLLRRRRGLASIEG